MRAGRLLLALLTVLLVWAAPPVRAQSLADLARQEEARRKAARERAAKEGQEGAVETYTNTSLEETDGELAFDPEKNDTATTSAGTAAESGRLDRERSTREELERTWRDRAAQARAHIEDARAERKYLSGLSLVAGEYYVDENGKVLVRDLAHLRRLVAEADARLAAAEGALSDLERSARKQSIPPGWLR
jgi:hypothetical protein